MRKSNTFVNTLSVKRTYHFLRQTLIKIPSIKMNHDWYSLQKHIAKNKPFIESKKSKIRWNRKRSFFRITETARLPGTELGTNSSQYGGYILVWNRMNSYWKFWIGGLSWRFSASSFSDFWKIAFCNFTAFFSFLTKGTLWSFRCAPWGELSIAYICVQMQCTLSVLL